MRRPNMSVLAKEAGVGVSTVDRVLNGRAEVREDTARRVLEAAERIGFYATPLLRHRLKADLPQRTFAFLLQQKSTPFYKLLGEALQKATDECAGVRGKAVIEFMEDLTPGAVAETLLRMGKVADGIAVVAADHPNVTAAIDTLGSKSVPVVALVSDLTAASRAGYVGLDNRKVGRTAAWFLSNMLPAGSAVSIFVGSHRYLCQEACEIGFRSCLRERAPDFVLIDPVATLESDHYAFEATLDLLRRHPGLAGLYVAGGGIGGVLKAVKEAAGERVPTIIGHDLTDPTIHGLVDGTLSVVLSHPIEAVATQAVELLAQKSLQPKSEWQYMHHNLPLQIFTPESV
ncbi:LacI family transcriptional regulator [Phyllobacterium brassicacearum]|uniref:LacI family transcriptional regulator n=1 Tax=Phyllobacterium brassicacearum TaxID=314235 RepID=A0A2P7BN08_9HYPH|nr:LacI family DNA-binding transcriptional regulator [Phyllobacterium brassicacearum]PSH67842.1 LacI family transcriptional regulator [Phyllobacterium brassicacearum]TDQ27390.1 LacI family transcriptional regulator [Phyllobacterium brassicacearum]